MCGIVGYFGTKSDKSDKAFRDMLVFDVVRGMDSTGVAFIGYQGNYIAVEKLAVHSLDYLAFSDFDKQIRKANIGLIGHNRAATIGKITDENAHPFYIGHIVGVHNGTLTNKWELPAGSSFETDSEALFNCIAVSGIKKTWNTIRGAAAIVFWNHEEKSMNLITNGERPLWFAETKDGSGVFWASESWMIRTATSRQKIELSKHGVVTPKPNVLFSFMLDKNKVNFSTTRLQPAPKTPVFHYNTGNYGKAWKDRNKVNHNVAVQVKDLFKDLPPEKKDDKGITLPINKPILDHKPLGPKPAEDPPASSNFLMIKAKGKVEGSFRNGFRNQILSSTQFSEFYTRCASCDEPLDFNDVGIEFYDENTAACGKCATTIRDLNIPHSCLIH